MKQMKGAEAPPDAFVEAMRLFYRPADEDFSEHWYHSSGHLFRAGHSAGLLRAAEIAEACTARAEEEPENNGFLSAMEYIAAAIRAEASPRAEGEKERRGSERHQQ